MSEVKHTKGPWRVVHEPDNDLGREFCIVSDDGIYVLDAVSGISPAEQEANATIGAAAPELLEALQELVDGMTDVEDSESKVLAKARAAIALATGAAS